MNLYRDKHRAEISCSGKTQRGKIRTEVKKLAGGNALSWNFAGISQEFFMCQSQQYSVGIMSNALHEFHHVYFILGDPGANSRGEGKSKRARKNGTKKSKDQRKEPLGTMSYQTSTKRSPPFWLLIGARKLLCFSAQSEARTVATVWNWSGKTLSPGALFAGLYFSSCPFFWPV